MQTIEHSYTHKLKTLCQVEFAYYLMSDYDSETKNKYLPYEFFSLVDAFVIHGYNIIPKFFIDVYDSVDTPKDRKFMVICCSGGKDSVATALLYKKWGYKVILYHMKGINPAYWDEHQAVKKIADDLEVPYYIDGVKLKGKHQYVEHPMKNMLIANGAIQFCMDNNLPVNIAFGNYYASRLDDMDFEIDAGDSRDMWDIYETIIKREIPDFEVHTPLRNVKNTYNELLHRFDLLQDSISCMSPYRFRKHWKERTEKKFGIKLMLNRCGCCWKCCMEYMVLVDCGILQCDIPYYNHCFSILTKTALKETGAEAATAEQIWNRYFWYDISESHLKFEI